MSHRRGLNLQRIFAPPRDRFTISTSFERAIVDGAGGFAFEAMAVASAMVAPARLGTRNPHSVQGVVFALGARVLVSDNQRLLLAAKHGGTEAVSRGLDTHEATD